MKKLVLTVLLGFIATSVVFGDTRFDKRKNCSRYISYKYKCWATIVGKQMSQGDHRSDAGCAVAECQAFAVNNGGILNGGTQKGNIKAKHSASVGQETKGFNLLHFDSGFDPRSIIIKLKNYNIFGVENINTVPSVGSLAVNSHIDFADSLTTNNNIRFSGMTGYMLIPNNDPTVRLSYEVIIWASDSLTDTVITTGKILKQSSFIFTNNGYFSYGDLFNQGASILQTDSGKYLTLNNTKDTLMSFDANKSIVITVRFHCDETSYGQPSTVISDNNPMHTTNKYLEDEVGFSKFNFIVAKENVEMLYEKNGVINNSSELSIENVGLDGKVRGKKIQIPLNEGSEKQQIYIPKNDLNLEPGINFLRIQYGKEVFLYRLFVLTE